MPSLHDLPAELLDSVCADLSQSDNLSLRLVNRQMASNMTDYFIEQFDSISVTCSCEGLDRLEKPVAVPSDQHFILEKVKHITIYVLTPRRLHALADMMDDEEEGSEEGSEVHSDPYLLAYMRVREVLIRGLNAFPNLEAVTVTNQVFEHHSEPEVSERDDQNYNDYEHEVTVEMDPLRDFHGEERFVEIVLSIMPDLNSQDIELRMILNYSQHDREDGRGCQVEPFLYPNEHLRRRMHGYEDGDNPEEWLRTRLQQMFGDPEFSAGNIIAKYLKRLHLRHYERPNWIFLEPPGDDIKTWVVKAPLTHLVLDGSWLTGTMIFFGGGDPLPEDGLKLHFPKLTHLRLVASNVSERVPRWMEYHARTMKLRRVQFVESRALPAVWSEIKDTY
jgi:hypothetical protein